MKTKNRCLTRRRREKLKNENSPAQRDSRNSILVSHLCNLRNLRTNFLPAQRYSGISILKVESENSTAQLDSKMSNGRLSGVFCRRQGGRLPETSTAQRDSEMYNLKAETENTLPQPDSKMSNLVLTPSPQRSLRLNLLSAQQYSKMSNGRLSGLLCWPHGQKAMSTARIKNKVDAMGVMGVMGVMGQKHKTKNSSAQQDSEISNLTVSLTSPTRPTSPTERQRAPAQADSGIYKLAVTVKTIPAQLDSKIYNLKGFLKTSPVKVNYS